MISIRPVLVIQNNMGNQHSPTIIAAIITGQPKSQYLPTHVLLTGSDCGLPKISMVMLEQIRTLDKGRLLQFAGHIAIDEMPQINMALGISVGLTAVNSKVKADTYFCRGFYHMNVNINYIGVLNLLRQLVKAGAITRAESKKIARHIAIKTGANIVIPDTCF